MGVGRRACIVLALAAGIVALATPAWAHGQIRPGRAAAGATVETVLLVPSERDGHGNGGIALALPPGFVASSCGAPTGWRCTIADKGFSWERVTGSAEAERFDLTMQVASTAGTYVLPMSQRYDDGETRRFTGGPGTRGEAPLFTVTGQNGPASTALPSPRGAAAPDAALSSLPIGRRLEPASSGGAPIALVAIGFVALTVLGGAVLVARQRRMAPSDDSSTGAG